MCHLNYFKPYIFAPPIFRASRKGNIAKLKNLLAAKAKVNIRRRDGTTPLMVASLHGNIDAAQFLIQNGADVNAHDNKGMTPLAIASLCSKKYLHLLKRRYHNMVDRSHRMNVDGTVNFPIYYPAYRDMYVDVAKLLVQHGADVNLGDAQSNTPLMYAAFSGNEKLVEFLVSSGANVNAANYEGATPLMNAVLVKSFASTDVIKMLIEHGADVNAAEKDGMTVMSFASVRSSSDIKQLLRDNGAKGEIISCCRKRA